MGLNVVQIWPKRAAAEDSGQNGHSVERSLVDRTHFARGVLIYPEFSYIYCLMIGSTVLFNIQMSI